MAKKNIRGDKNLYRQTAQTDAMTWHNPRSEPFVIGGLPWLAENNDYGRLPKQIRPRLRESLAWVSMQPSGVTIRFRTDSRRLAIKVGIDRNEHFPLNSVAQESGFDVYLGNGKKCRFHRNLSADKPRKHYAADCQLPDGIQDVTIYFPLLNPVKRIHIGLDDNAKILKPNSFQNAPILFYGSSITQGFSCSRPGLTYPAQICRDVQAPLINMGFGGNAKGDLIIAENFADMMKTTEVSAFIYDYDHNAPSVKHLRETHEKFFKCIRKAHPKLPIVIVSSPVYWREPEYFGKRFDVIRRTYQNAKKRGDKHVYLVNGRHMWKDERHWQDCTVDQLHPNDVGFRLMANKICQTVQRILK